MNQELKKKWVAALRSGKYKQGIGQLRSDDDRFCCLGVLCMVQKRKWNRTYGEYAIGTGREVDSGGEENRKLQDDIDGMAHKLIQLNDLDRASFEQIADYIEEEL